MQWAASAIGKKSKNLSPLWCRKPTAGLVGDFQDIAIVPDLACVYGQLARI
jgi:hypothetical protein